MVTMKVSQIFFSAQGEGVRTGVMSVWLRTFGCPLRCAGFFQKNPTDSYSYEPIINFNPAAITRLEDLPVIEYGCDTLYAIDPRFKHLRRDLTVQEVYDEVVGHFPKAHNGKPTAKHPVTGNCIDFCITGGEPLLQQDALYDLLVMMWDNFDVMPVVQFETNLTRKLSAPMQKFINESIIAFFNISPKLFHVSGEDYDWSAENFMSIHTLFAQTSLKIVINDSDVAWEELDAKVRKLKAETGSNVPIYIMPVGATYEQQSDSERLGKIATRAIQNGYHVSGRLHCNIWGNDVNS